VRSPIADLKAIKNAKEIEGFRASHIRDGSALVRYFAWLEEQLNNGHELSESQGADQLEKFRGRVSPNLYAASPYWSFPVQRA
jgi:Xaa-Pro aminopeptidase